MAKETVTTPPPSEENRQQAIKILSDHMVATGADQADADDAATAMIDAAILARAGVRPDEETGEVGSDTEPD